MVQTVDAPAAIHNPSDYFVFHYPRDTFEAYLQVDQDGFVSARPDREQLHINIIENTLAEADPVPLSNTPKAIIVMGAPASGKTRLLEQLKEQSPTDYVHVDVNRMKGQLPEYQEAVSQGLRAASLIVHEEASYLAKATIQEAIDTNRNLMVDGYGKDPEAYRSLIHKLKENGYEVGIVMTHVPEAIATQRLEGREPGSAYHFVKANHNHVPKTFAAVKDEVHKFQVYDTSAEPKVIWAKNEKGEKVLDPKLAKEVFRDVEQSVPRSPATRQQRSTGIER